LGRRFALHATGNEVWFQHAEPDYAADCERLFDCSVRFRQASNGVLFPREALEREHLHADPALHTLLLGFADNLEAEIEGETTLHERVRIALRYETDLAKVDSEKLARRWGLSRRALRRRLTSEGSSLSALLDEARLQRAVRELKRPECKIRDLAEDLGYSETSAFHRAFKRWTRRTPTEFRAELLERSRDASQKTNAELATRSLNEKEFVRKRAAVHQRSER
jgi:AraC-like DNA-binding protein